MASNYSENQSVNQVENLVYVNSVAKIGAVLKEERKKQNMTCALLAASLRMGQEQLIALEEGNIKSLPEEVFVKAMIRRVAERLRLDSDELIQEFQRSSEDLDQVVNKENALSNKKAFISKKLKKNWKPLSLIFGLGAVTLFAILGNNTLQKKYENNNNAAIIEATKNGSQLKEKRLSREIKISSIKPTKATIKNDLGQVLFEGTIKETLQYPLNNGLKIYAFRPDLIEIESEGMISTILGSTDDIKWHDLSSLINN